MAVPDPVFDYDEALAQGYAGYEVDPTPNENYSLQTPQDAPTPETDPDTRKAAQDRAVELRTQLSGTTPPTEAPATTTKSTRSSGSSSSSSSGS